MTNLITKSSDIPWISSLKIDPIPVLLDSAPLPVRYLIHKDILDDTESDDVLALQKNLRKHRPRRKLLSEQDESGLWSLSPSSQLSEPQRKTLQLLRQLEVLHELLDMTVTGKTERALLGMREVLRLLAENDFELRLHHESQAIYLAIIYGLEGNPIIKELIWDILKRQNSDGGWSSMQGEPGSCVWSTQFFLFAIGHSEKFKKNRTLLKGLSYLRDHRLKEGQSELIPGMQAWDTFHSGYTGLSILGGGSLRSLEVEQLYHDQSRDRKIEKLIDWLLQVQLKTGMWPNIVGRDSMGDAMVSLRVLRVLKHFEGLRVDETQLYDDEDEQDFE